MRKHRLKQPKCTLNMCLYTNMQQIRGNSGRGTKRNTGPLVQKLVAEQDLFVGQLKSKVVGTADSQNYSTPINPYHCANQAPIALFAPVQIHQSDSQITHLNSIGPDISPLFYQQRPLLAHKSKAFAFSKHVHFTHKTEGNRCVALQTQPLIAPRESSNKHLGAN